MPTDLKERRFPFVGEDTDYILYLEFALLKAQGTTSTRCLRPSSLTSSDSPSDSDLNLPMYDCRFIYCSLSKKTSRTPIGKNQSLSSQTAYLGRGHPKQKYARLPQWRREMNRFVRSIPSLKMWAAKRDSCGFSTSASNHIILLFNSC
jgi:hypothetical protein